jgi:hypothetical protein
MSVSVDGTQRARLAADTVIAGDVTFRAQAELGFGVDPDSVPRVVVSGPGDLLVTGHTAAKTLALSGDAVVTGLTSHGATWIGGPLICQTGAGGSSYLDLRNDSLVRQIVLDPNGGVVASKNGSGVWVTPVSDERLKINIVSVDPAVASAELCALRLVTFDYTAEAAAALGITGLHTQWCGFLADEYDLAMGTLPEDRVLSTINLPVPEGEGPYHTIDTGRAAYCLYAAHKHAMTQIAALTARLDAAGL